MTYPTTTQAAPHINPQETDSVLMGLKGKDFFPKQLLLSLSHANVQ
jgi:hypothetical protein